MFLLTVECLRNAFTTPELCAIVSVAFSRQVQHLSFHNHQYKWATTMKTLEYGVVQPCSHNASIVSAWSFMTIIERAWAQQCSKNVPVTSEWSHMTSVR